MSPGPGQQHLPEEREIPGPVPDSLNLISGVDTGIVIFCINDSGAREDLITICSRSAGLEPLRVVFVRLKHADM